MAADPYKYFRVEASELVDQLAEGALAIERGALAAPSIAGLLRSAHTLKGAARVVRQTRIADHAHAIEDALAPFRDGAGTVPSHTANSLFEAIEQIRPLLRQLGAPETPVEAKNEPRQRQRTVRAEIADVDIALESLKESGAELSAFEQSLRTLGDIRERLDVLASELLAPTRGGEEQLERSVRRAAAVVQDLALGARAVEQEVVVRVQRLGREMDQVHSSVERLRLVPVSSIATELATTARTVAHELGKRVTFEARGGDIRLDGHMLDRVRDAMLHVVRNAVVHGIEPAAERRQRGKAPVGRIGVEVKREGRHVVFRCTDDGRGVDQQALRRVLRDRGHQVDVGSASEPELLQALLKSGVSTSEAVTDLAGRGVGLDVLRDVAEQLGGTVHFETIAGEGLSVELRVPQSLAALEGLFVRAGETAAIVPIDSVVRICRAAPDEVTRSSGAETLSFEGREIPFVRLAGVIGRSGGRPPVGWAAVIVRTREGELAVGVDRLLGTKPFVLRNLPATMVASRAIAGAALDSLGNPELVVDPDGLLAEALEGVHPAEPEARRPNPILVVDDSLTTRMLERSILESAGYDVETATSGEEALERARGGAHSLFLVDVEMPGMDGFTFIERALADPLVGDVPAVMVSSRSGAEDFSRARAAGAKGYIVKGEFDQRTLLALIEELVGT